MYTLKKKTSKVKAYSTSVNNSSVGGPYFSGYIVGWVIINPKGTVIANASSKVQAELIVKSLNSDQLRGIK